MYKLSPSCCVGSKCSGIICLLWMLPLCTSYNVRIRTTTFIGSKSMILYLVDNVTWFNDAKLWDYDWHKCPSQDSGYAHIDVRVGVNWEVVIWGHYGSVVSFVFINKLKHAWYSVLRNNILSPSWYHQLVWCNVGNCIMLSSIKIKKSLLLTFKLKVSTNYRAYIASNYRNNGMFGRINTSCY